MFKRITLNKIINKDFLNIFLEQRNFDQFYGSIKNALTGSLVFQNSKIDIDDFQSKSSVYIISDLPGYLNTKIKSEDQGWRSCVINTFKGTCIRLGSYDNLEDYLKKKFSAKRRSKLRTYRKRLELAFPIKYEAFYGKISRDKYEQIFEVLHQMIERRFEERKDHHHDLFRWETYYDITYPLILNKEAVLFVIYDREKPISIAINLLQEKLMYAFIRGYDIDYSKFYLGFTDFINQMDWAFKNSIEVFDMLKGSYEYKTRFIDQEYFFQKQLIYNVKNLKSRFTARIIITRIRLFYLLIGILKGLSVHKLYHGILRYYSSFKYGSGKKTVTYAISDEPKELASNHLKQVDVTDASFSFLRRPINDFLYRNEETDTDLSVYEILNQSDSYLIKGSKVQSKVSFSR